MAGFSVWKGWAIVCFSPEIGSTSTRLTTDHREACRIANCLDFIEAWDQGFDTVRFKAFGFIE